MTPEFPGSGGDDEVMWRLTWGEHGEQEAALKAKSTDCEQKEKYISRLEARLLAQHKLLRQAHDCCCFSTACACAWYAPDTIGLQRAELQNPRMRLLPQWTTKSVHRPASLSRPLHNLLGWREMRRCQSARGSRMGLCAGALRPTCLRRPGRPGKAPPRPDAGQQGPVYYVLNPLAADDLRDTFLQSPMRPPLRKGLPASPRNIPQKAAPQPDASPPPGKAGKGGAVGRGHTEAAETPPRGRGGPAAAVRHRVPGVWTPPPPPEAPTAHRGIPRPAAEAHPGSPQACAAEQRHRRPDSLEHPGARG
eukprot:jgi/Botrbrau1/22170/Bobra.168_1s0002.1